MPVSNLIDNIIDMLPFTNRDKKAKKIIGLHISEYEDFEKIKIKEDIIDDVKRLYIKKFPVVKFDQIKISNRYIPHRETILIKHQLCPHKYIYIQMEKMTSDQNTKHDISRIQKVTKSPVCTFCVIIFVDENDRPRYLIEEYLC